MNAGVRFHFSFSVHDPPTSPRPRDSVAHSQDGPYHLCLPSLEICTQMCPEVCLLGDSRPYRVLTITQTDLCKKESALQIRSTSLIQTFSFPLLVSSVLKPR